MRSEDVESLTGLLGRPPGERDEVEERDASGLPRVVRCYPLKRQGDGGVEPFPTLYWLVCPELSRAVADQERQGLITELSEQLRVDGELMERHRAAHVAYAAERWGWMDPADQQHAETAGFTAVLRDTGVAGAAHPDAVKCLHAHVAHELATRANPLGKRVLKRLL